MINEHPHKRLNILTGEWIPVSPYRAKRPWQGQTEELFRPPHLSYDPECYLCPGNVRVGGIVNPNYDSTFVFQNDFAALYSDAPEENFNEKNLLVAENERGICRVVCFSPDHSLTLARMKPEEINHDAIVKLMVGRDIERFYKPTIATNGDSAIEINDLQTRRYPNKSISFEVRKGEILGFAGLVGAGRSEAAQAIFGVDPTIGGTVSIDGEKIKINSARDAIKRGIYLIPEDRRNSGLILDVPIRENVTLASLSKFTSAGLVNKSAEGKISREMCEKLNVKTQAAKVIR